MPNSQSDLVRFPKLMKFVTWMGDLQEKKKTRQSVAGSEMETEGLSQSPTGMSGSLSVDFNKLQIQP